MKVLSLSQRQAKKKKTLSDQRRKHRTFTMSARTTSPPPRKRSRTQGPSSPPAVRAPGSGSSDADELRARPREFQAFAGGRGRSVVAEHVASLLATRDVARLMRTAKDLKDAGELPWKLWEGSGKRMGKALDARDAQRSAARAGRSSQAAEGSGGSPDPPRTECTAPRPGCSLRSRRWPEAR